MAWEILAGAGVGALGGVLNNERNLAFAKDAQNYNKWAQERTWEREDNAIQRRAADMKLAGLHPTLAAGNAAQAGSPTKIDPVTSQDPFASMIEGASKGAQSRQSYWASEAAQSQISLNEAGVMKAGAEANRAAMQAAQIGKEWGIGPNAAKPFLHDKYKDVWGKRIETGLEKLGDIAKMPFVQEGMNRLREGGKKADEWLKSPDGQTFQRMLRKYTNPIGSVLQGD